MTDKERIELLEAAIRKHQAMTEAIKEGRRWSQAVVNQELWEIIESEK
jgi:hypothetical protein